MKRRGRERVLVLSPHPDDESIGCGGTLAAHVAAGARVRVIFLTSGERGGHDGRPPEATARTREREAAVASRRLGLEAIEFWRLPDGALGAGAAAVARLRRALLGFRPAVLYAPHAAEAHPDHRAAARLARAALRGLPAGAWPQACWGFEVWTPIARIGHIVDITAHIETKVHAVRAYRSQCQVLAFDAAMRGLARYRGEMFSWPEGDYAEVFTPIAALPAPPRSKRRRRTSPGARPTPVRPPLR